ncbi:hypothetical protein QOZ80_3BG0280030 [Eleusine coracana subsp. coracana]|nr:hypothetical protein QOZ80_3BG0280030 [Eleusine coracana subsp. coracana]
MEAVLMQRAAMAWSRCAGEAASLAGRGQRAAVVRLGVARRAAAGTGSVRARLGPARAHVSEARSTEEEGIGEDEEAASAVSLFVGLPEDVVCHDGRAVSRPRAVRAALRALKLLGVDGVELPVSWAVAQPAGEDDAFEWAGYLAVAGMVRDAGLGLRVSLRTDGPALPAWAAADSDVLVADREGNRREGCLSFAVDELPVLGGKSAVEAYEALFSSFGDAFADFIGSTVTDVTVSLGPNGELRYPSYPPVSVADTNAYAGAGEFQCHDKHALASLKRHAESSGQPLWGLSGPHDGPRYDDEFPDSCAFFRSPGGSWNTAYGEFFLSWYAGELLAHGDRVLAAASRAFAAGKPVQLSAKVPLLLPYGSRAAEATAGFHGGYGPVAEMFARHGCTVIASGSSPVGVEVEEVLARVKGACAEHGARLALESAPLAVVRDGDAGAWAGLVSGERTAPCQFTYQRMGAEFFGPSHWPLFVQFVRALEFPEEAHEDDMPAGVDCGGDRLTVPSASSREAQDEEAREVQTV